MRPLRRWGLGLVLTCLLSPGAGAAPKVVVGSTNFTEQLILANIYARVLADRGIEVRKRLNLGSREIVYPALRAGEVDVVPEYTGALLSHVADSDQLPTRDEQAIINALRARLPSELELLEASAAQNRDTLVVRPETAARYELETFSDLAPVSGQLIAGGPPEMKTRWAGLPGLASVYGIEFKAFRALDAGGPVTVGALANGSIDVARMFTTQAIVEARGWVQLTDDKGLNPPQNVVPLAREDAVTAEIRAALNGVSAALSTRTLERLNHKVEVDSRDPAKVAAYWVRANDLDE